jgi:hypothetical protein
MRGTSCDARSNSHRGTRWRTEDLDANIRRNEQILMLTPGTNVEVRGRFRGVWCRGFEVVECNHDDYVLRRRSDRSVLPSLFASRDVRRAE